MSSDNASNPDTVLRSSENVNSSCTNDEDTWKTPFSLLLTIGPLVLIFVGTIGNTISYLVLKRRAYEKNIMAGALRYLAVVDNTILWTFILKLFVEGAFEYDIGNISYKACGLWSTYALSISSIDSWLLVVISATRLIHIKYPFREHNICSRSHYYIALVLMHVCVIAAHGSVQHAIYLQRPKHGQIKKKCALVLADIEQKNQHLLAITTTVNFVGPCILLFIFTTLILQGLKTVDSRKSYFYSPVDLDNDVTVAASGRHQPKNVENVDATQNALANPNTLNDQQFISTPKMKCKASQEMKSIGLDKYNISKRLISSFRSQYLQNQCTNQMKIKTPFNPCCKTKSIDKASKSKPLLSNKRSYTPVMDANNNTQTLTHPEDTRSSAQTGQSREEPGHDGGNQAETQENGTSSFGANAESTKKARNVHTTFEDGIKDDEEEEPARIATLRTERISRVSGLTRILVAACGVFFILNIPFWVFYTFFSATLKGKDVGCYYRKFVVQCAILFKFSNHSVNFVFYSLTCPRFREELKDMLQGRKVPRVSIALY